MLKRAAAIAVLLAMAAAASGWIATAANPLQADQLPQHAPDIGNGERIFHAAGCASCHAAPNATGEERLKLGGGLELNTPFGLFRVPNISPDRESGIGGWSDVDFVNAVMRGVSPEGAHYYPAFPYGSYAKMRIQDVLDLGAFMGTLPPVSNDVAGHELGFPYSVRRAVGLWKRLYVSPDPVIEFAGASDLVRRGQYLVEGPGHCGECHTVRDALGGWKAPLWLAGARNLESEGRIPNITPHEDGIADWSEADIADALRSGLTPDFDEFEGRMAAVQEELSHLPEDDLQAIAAYLKAVPPLPDAVPRANTDERR